MIYDLIIKVVEPLHFQMNQIIRIVDECLQQSTILVSVSLFKEDICQETLKDILHYLFDDINISIFIKLRTGTDNTWYNKVL